MSEPGWTPGPGLCWCGLTLSRNPHPDAGRPDESGAAVGYVYECIPCLVKTRNRVGTAWRKAQAENERLIGTVQGIAHELLQIEESCPCGARPESLDTHPHVTGCPVKRALDIWEGAFVRGAEHDE